MIITTDLIKSLNPCKDRLDNFLTHYGHYWQGTHREFAALSNVSDSDKRWVLDSLYIQKFSFRPSSGIPLETLLSVLDYCDEQEAAKPKDIYTKIAEEGQISRDTVKLVEMAASICLNKDEFKRNPKDTPMFQVGDIVEWCGVRGVVESTSSMLSSVQCMFGHKDNTRKQTFTSDGKLCTWHIVPSLKLIERPKKKIKKYKVLFKRLEYENQFQVSGDHYADREDFESRTYGNQFIQLIKESEIEVEE